MSGIGLNILAIILLLLLNGILAMSETALLSVRKARLQTRANEGDRRARAALQLAQTPNRFLSTIQVGITLIDVLTGTIICPIFTTGTNMQAKISRLMVFRKDERRCKA